MILPHYPIYILEKGKEDELPKEGTYGIVTSEGTFLHKDTGLIKATVKLGGFSCLGKVSTEAKLFLPKIPAELSAQIVAFFRSVYEKYQSEAIILLHYSKETGEYSLVCPEQKVSSVFIDHYAMNDRIPGYQLVGTIHSHGNMPAFHSETDRQDESSFDGLHITIGDLSKRNPGQFGISCTVSVNNNRFSCLPEDFLFGVQPVLKPEPTWLKPKYQYKQEEEQDESLLPDSTFTEKPCYLSLWNLYEHEVLTNTTDCSMLFPESWIAKVSKISYRFNGKEDSLPQKSFEKEWSVHEN